jgi:hypothetical protein
MEAQLPVGPPCRVQSSGDQPPHFGGTASHKVSPFPSEPCAVKNKERQLRYHQCKSNYDCTGNDAQGQTISKIEQ